MREPIVSVVLPTHNRAASLGRAVDSVLSQSFENLELIVVDDASSDATADLLAKICDPRLRVIRQPANSGPGAARNAGIAQAAGKFVGFQDSDAEWLPEKLTRQVSLLESALASNSNVAGCYSRFIVTSRRGKRVLPVDPPHELSGNIFARLLYENVVDTPSLLVKRELLEEVGLFDEGLKKLEDWDLALRICSQHPMAFLDEVTLVSYDSPDSVNKRVAPESVLKILGKHSAAFERSPAALGLVTWMIGSGYANLGERKNALRFMRISMAQSGNFKKKMAYMAIAMGMNPYPALRKIRRIARS